MFTRSLTAAALAGGFIAATAHAQNVPRAADPTVAGSQLIIESPIRTYKNAAAMAQSSTSWTEANVAVTSQGGHDMHGMNHGASPSEGMANPHAGHTTSPEASKNGGASDHAGHQGQTGTAVHNAPQKASAGVDPHAGHVMPKSSQAVDQPRGQEDHSMHGMSDHAGHNMSAGAKATGKSAPPKAASGKRPVLAPTQRVMPKAPSSTSQAGGGEDHSMHQMGNQPARQAAPVAKPAAQPTAKPVAPVAPAAAKPRPAPAPKPASQAPAEMDHGGHQ